VSGGHRHVRLRRARRSSGSQPHFALQKPASRFSQKAFTSMRPLTVASEQAPTFPRSCAVAGLHRPRSLPERSTSQPDVRRLRCLLIVGSRTSKSSSDSEDDEGRDGARRGTVGACSVATVSGLMDVNAFVKSATPASAVRSAVATPLLAVHVGKRTMTCLLTLLEC